MSPLENLVHEQPERAEGAPREASSAEKTYVAAMHRKIHEAWAWGFFEQLDTRNETHPLNDYDLWTRVEIVLDSTGSVDSVTTVRGSGNKAFDRAAIEVVKAVGPYGSPPAQARSADTKTYLHWSFHRDERACGPFGVGVRVGRQR